MPNGSYSINTAWYLDLNRIARGSSWAHAIMATYSHFLGIGLLALVLLGAWWSARRAVDPAQAVAGVLWAAGGTVLAWLIAHFVLKPVVAERRPYLALAHVEVLLTRTHGYSFPSGHATVAGAVVIGLVLARRPIACVLATLLGLLLGFGRVYTGMHYPFDVVGGLVIGGLVIVVTWAVAVPALERLDQHLLGTRFAPLVAAGGAGSARGARLHAPASGPAFRRPATGQRRPQPPETGGKTVTSSESRSIWPGAGSAPLTNTLQVGRIAAKDAP